MQRKSRLKSFLNRFLHLLARFSPGATSVRPLLHRLRGVKINGRVFIGDEAYIENEYPECVEICDGAQIGLRTIILAHMRGPGKVVVGKQAYIGPNCVIATSSGRTLRIGEGSVIAASSVITSDVDAFTFVRSEPPRSVAQVAVPLAVASSYQDFLLGLGPLRKQNDEQCEKTGSIG